MLKRVFSSCSVEGANKSLDLGILATNTIFSDELLFRTVWFEELPELINFFGFEGLLELLTKKHLKFQADAFSVGESNSGNHGSNRFSFITVRAAYPENQAQERIERVLPKLGLDPKVAARLRYFVLENTLNYRGLDNAPILVNLHDDLRNNSMVLKLAAQRQIRESGLNVPSLDQISLRFIEESRNVYAVESNLNSLLRVDDEKIKNIISRTGCAAGSLHQALAVQAMYDSSIELSPFHRTALSLRFGELWQKIGQPNLAEPFSRVAFELAGVDLGAKKKLDVFKLLELKKTAEFKEFSRWIQTCSPEDIEEFVRRSTSLHGKISTFLGTTPGQLLRFATTSSLGLLAAGPFAGLAIGAADTFLLNKVIAADPKAIFISEKVPTILT